MAGLFDEFKQHATELHKTIKLLEKTYRNPYGFYGSTSRSESANTILRGELESVINISTNYQQTCKDLEDNISENDQLLAQVDEVYEEAAVITELLEKQGFRFSVENNAEECGSESETNENAENIEHIEHIEHQECLATTAILEKVEDELCNLELKNEDPTEKILRDNEKYMQVNNIDLDDIVTPYIPRKSWFSGNKS